MTLARATLLAVLTLVLSVGFIEPASAASATVRDARGEVPARVDLTWATYTNGPNKVRFSVRVRNLRGAGQVAMVSAYPDSDGFWVVRVTKNGHSFVMWTNVGNRPLRCRGIRSSWQPGRNRVTATIPRRCIPIRGRQYMTVRSHYAGSYDWAPHRTLRRG